MRKREKDLITMLAIRMCICSCFFPTSLVLDLTSQMTQKYLFYPATTQSSAMLLFDPTTDYFGQCLQGLTMQRKRWSVSSLDCCPNILGHMPDTGEMTVYQF